MSSVRDETYSLPSSMYISISVLVGLSGMGVVRVGAAVGVKISRSSAVYMAARIGDIGEPCGMPFSTRSISPRMPSRHTVPVLRKLAVHFTY